ncbi:DUF6928 family protein [Corynebacterium otitidis]|uniref:DUF6928 family protein n=1 Tax=Corynebacterium otitidis TaxID=29321 RepID=UPI000627DF04|nr:hypothetical protein [Corynebacterium otitidis]KKO83313.1 hypothetical protein AAV33_07100 [Corynebacterium otitidis]
MTLFRSNADDTDGPSLSAPVTLWFVSTPDPGSVLRAGPRADRGFARKYLAQLNPAWPVTPIGVFPLNRSTAAAAGEFYIAGYPDITVVQTVLHGLKEISGVDKRLLESRPADRIFAFAREPEAGYGAFAHWADGRLERAFAATRTAVYEDTGVPEPFEGPFWAGEHGDDEGGISLPFRPTDLVDAAESSWLGADTSSEGVDLDIAAFAVDGRRAPRLDERSLGRGATFEEMAASANSALGIGGHNADYDDYEEGNSRVIRAGEGQPDTGDEFARLAEAAGAAARRVGRGAWRRTKTLAARLRDRLRHTDR